MSGALETLERWLSGPRECADIPEAEIVYEEPASTGGRSPEQDVTLYYAGNITDTAPEARGRSMPVHVKEKP